MEFLYFLKRLRDGSGVWFSPIVFPQNSVIMVKFGRDYKKKVSFVALFHHNVRTVFAFFYYHYINFFLYRRNKKFGIYSDDEGDDVIPLDLENFQRTVFVSDDSSDLAN